MLGPSSGSLRDYRHASCTARFTDLGRVYKDSLRDIISIYTPQTKLTTARMQTLKDISQVFRGSPSSNGHANGIGLGFVQTAMEIRRQMPQVLDEYYMVLADVDTGHSLFLKELPKMTPWLRRAPRLDLSSHVQQNLKLLRTSSHMKMMNYDNYRLYLYRRQLLDFISTTGQLALILSTSMCRAVENNIWISHKLPTLHGRQSHGLSSSHLHTTNSCVENKFACGVDKSLI